MLSRTRKTFLLSKRDISILKTNIYPCVLGEHSQREDTQVSGIPKASRGDQATNPPNENLCGQTADTSNENQGDRGINPPNENRCGQTADTSNENQDDQGINPPNDNLPGQTTDTSNDNQGDEATKSDRSEQDDEYGTLFLSCWNLDI